MKTLEERKENLKREVELLKQDMVILNKLVAHIEENLESVSEETIEDFDAISEDLIDELEIIEL